MICGRLRYPIEYIAQNKIQILQIYIEGQYVIAITNMDGSISYFAALNENWDFTHCDILGLGLVIFVFKSSVVYKNSHSVSAETEQEYIIKHLNF